MSSVTRFLGGKPSAVIVKLVLISLLVGGIMTAVGWTPFDLVRKILRFFEGLWNLGFGAIEHFAQFLIVGAMVVVPIFLVMRLLAMNK